MDYRRPRARRRALTTHPTVRCGCARVQHLFTFSSLSLWGRACLARIASIQALSRPWRSRMAARPILTAAQQLGAQLSAMRNMPTSTAPFAAAPAAHFARHVSFGPISVHLVLSARKVRSRPVRSGATAARQDTATLVNVLLAVSAANTARSHRTWRGQMSR